MDEQLKQIFAEEMAAAGVHDPSQVEGLFSKFRSDISNQTNANRLMTGKLQPGQAERVSRLQSVPQDQDPTLMGGVKAIGQAGLDMAKGVPQMVGDVGKMAALGLATDPDEQLAAKHTFDEGAQDLGAQAKGMAMAPINFAKGLGQELSSPYGGATVTQGDVDKTVGAGVGTAAGLFAARGLQPRAAALVSKLKGGGLMDQSVTNAARGMTDEQLAAQPMGTTPPMDQSAADPGVMDRRAAQAGERMLGRRVTDAPAPQGIGISPAFEEDLGPLKGSGSRGGPTASILRAAKSGVPTGIEESGLQAYPPTGVHPELQALYDEVLAPSKGGAPEEGAGFRSAASAKAKRASRSGVKRSERYRNTFDATGEGQPE